MRKVVCINNLIPFCENVKMKMVATSSQTCKVVVESSSRSILNLLYFGANKVKVPDLSDYTNNEVHKLTRPCEFPMRQDPIKFRQEKPLRGLPLSGFNLPSLHDLGHIGLYGLWI